MAETIKGEVAFKAADQNWKLVYDFNALCTIEEELEVDVADIGEQLSKPTMIRSIFRIGLAAHHGALSDLEAGRLIHDMGVAEAAQVVTKAFVAAFPEAKVVGSAGGKAPAPKPKPAPKKPGTGRKR
ncbi:hypothetical protein [Sphingomonas sp. S2-65]|uniref:hypothetical protein n=1 Tax=Sphingomonas sp. S2-65 TaxID=2903960 RepID=UPI001F333F08|nr:hypothetical protein [Sphingomonas sp. S2-65]UYY60105.1 hypothetical protein LZ586_08515 [Sphingomonas sp. S2-65]